MCKHHLNTDLLCKTTHHQCMKFQKGKSSYLLKLLERKNNTETIYSMIIELDAIPYCLDLMLLKNNTQSQCCNNWLEVYVCKHHLNTDLLCKTTHHQCMKFQKGKSSYLWKLLERKNNTETIYSMIIELDAIPYCQNLMLL